MICLWFNEIKVLNFSVTHWRLPKDKFSAHLLAPIWEKLCVFLSKLKYVHKEFFVLAKVTNSTIEKICTRARLINALQTWIEDLDNVKCEIQQPIRINHIDRIGMQFNVHPIWIDQEETRVTRKKHEICKTPAVNKDHNVASMKQRHLLSPGEPFQFHNIHRTSRTS